MNVLLVEDNDRMRQFIKSMLLKWQHNVYEANSGKTGIKLSIEKKPDVILMDINMEVMDGIEAVTIMRQNKVKSKIIMVTDYNEKILREKAKEAGADDYLLKENLLSLEKCLIDFSQSY